MNVRDINQDQLDEEENAGPLGALPTETFMEAAEFFPFRAIQSLRQTCRFFGQHVMLKETMDKKTIHHVITTGSQTYWFLKNGKVFGSGSNHFNALGLGKETGSCVNPMQIILPSNKPIAKIATGGDFIFCFDIEGSCFFCGCNSCGQLGKLENNDTIQYSFKTMRLPNDRPIVDVVAGSISSFLRNDEGTWYGMGENGSGQLGINSRDSYTNTPRQISLPNGLPIIKIITGGSHLFLQDTKDQWFHCGYGGSLGDHGTSIYAPEPFTLPDGQPIVEIVANRSAFFIRNREGRWYACGDNSSMQLGITWSPYLIPITHIQLPNGKPIVRIVTSGYHTCMCDIDGQWFGCGQNGYGQLLHQVANKIGLTPIELPNPKPIVEMCLGYNHTLLKDKDGNWYGCGENKHGQLGPDNMKKIGQLFYIDPTVFEKINAEIEEANKSLMNIT